MLTLVIGQLTPKNVYTFKAYLCLFYYQKSHNYIIRKSLPKMQTHKAKCLVNQLQIINLMKFRLLKTHSFSTKSIFWIMVISTNFTYFEMLSKRMTKLVMWRAPNLLCRLKCASKEKIIEEQGVGARSLARNTLGVEGHARALG